MLNRLLQFWFEPFIFWTRLQLSFVLKSTDLFLVFYIVVTGQFLELFGRKKWAELWRLTILVLSMPN
nr:hypothetical protein CFP56_51987 [Quercus suber]